jgi:glycosyltransferase involved in cell wall biosynthesis
MKLARCEKAKKPKSKIAVFLPHMHNGGAERVVLTLTNYWVALGFRVEIILLQKRGELLSLISKRIKIVDLKVGRVRYALIPLIKILSREKPDIFWVNMWPLTAISILAKVFLPSSTKIFLTEHESLSLARRANGRLLGAASRLTLALTYRFSDGVSGVSDGVVSDIAALARLNVRDVRTLYNPNHLNGVASAQLGLREKLWGKDQRFNILTVGRLAPEKNHSLLISAFSRIADKINARLIILGDGILRKELEDYVQELELQDRIFFPGFHIDPAPWYQTADLFVLSSDYEGFGNVLVEALSYGLRIISTRCPSGPEEVLQNGQFGLLVPVRDEISLASGILEALKSIPNKEKLVARAQEFAVERVSERYLDFFGLASQDN